MHKMAEQIKENKMGTAPMIPLILKMSLPVMFSMLIQSLYNVVDSIFVSNYSQKAFTAVNFAFPVQMLMIAVAVGTGVGINSLVSRRLGEKRNDEADSAASHGVVLGIISWLVFALAGIFLTKLFFNMYTDDKEIIENGIAYLSTVMIFSFGVFVEINIEKSIQATGNMIFPMLFQLTGAVANIILDPIFIFGLKMGAFGAAVATVLGQILSMIFSIIVAIYGNHYIRISLRGFRFSGKTVKNIYAVGFPAIIMQSIGSFMVSILNMILINISQAAVDVLGIYFKLQSFVFMPVFGLTQGLLPIIGYNFGARNKKRMLSAVKIGCVIGVLIMAAGTALFQLIPDKLIAIYNYSDDMMKIGVRALRTISLCFIPAALGIVFSSFFQGVGSGVRSLFISVLRQLIIIAPVAYYLSQFGEFAVWYAFPIAEAVSLLASILMFVHLYHKQIKNI